MTSLIKNFEIHIIGEDKQRLTRYIRLFKPTASQLQAGIKKAKYIMVKLINQSDISQTKTIAIWDNNKTPMWNYVTEQLRQGRYTRIIGTQEIILRNMIIPGTIITIPVKPSYIYSHRNGEFLKDKNNHPVIITQGSIFFTEEEYKDESYYKAELDILRFRIERYEITKTKLT